MEEEGLYYLCSENKGADQLRGYREADLRLCFHNAKHLFSHDAAHFMVLVSPVNIMTDQSALFRYLLQISLFLRLYSVLRIPFNQ